MKRRLAGREIQLYEVDLIDAFSAFCERHDLRWSVNGGTLLGAVRHRGFIPWDDDVDLDMPRPDYDRMLELVKMDSELPPYIDVRAPLPFCKWFDTRTLISRKKYNLPPEERHLWIDIFPLDGLPEDDDARRRLYQRQSLLCRAVSLLQFYDETEAWYRRLTRLLLRLPLRLVGRERLLRWLDSRARRIPYDASPIVGNVCWGAGWNEEVRKRDSWYQSQDLPFEHLKVNAPPSVICHQYLTQRYGDYMSLPPAEQRKAHEMEAWVKL